MFVQTRTHALRRLGATPIALRQGAEFTFGRSGGCSLAIDSPSVSRLHARIVWQGAVPILVDQSSYGTQVNGRAVRRHELSPGDEITIGPFVCVYVTASHVDQGLGGRAEAATVAGEGDSFAGTIGPSGLAEQLQSLEFNGRTGTLTVFGIARGQYAWLTVQGGTPLAAEANDLLDEAAVIHLAGLRTGRFSFVPELLTPVRRMRTTITGCLIEAGRREDEAAREGRGRD